MRLVIVAVALLACVGASDVLSVESVAAFDALLARVSAGETSALVAFTAVWCGHCKSLKPEYEIAATAFKGQSQVVIANVDADAHKELTTRFGVQGFPTIKFFAKGSDIKNPQNYESARTADGIVAFINEKTGARGRVKKEASAVHTLNKANFDKVVDGSKHAFVEFYAPWCGHCKTLAPKWEELGKIFQTEGDVVVAKVDADAADGRPLGERFGVKGFPTIKYFPKGSTTAEDYSGARETADLVRFLNDKAGTARLATGGLGPEAGRVKSLDELAAKVAAKTATSADVKKAAAALKGDQKTSGDFYAIVAQKVESEGGSFITKQKERLSGLLKSGSITPQKADEFQIKLNILAAFEK